MDKLKLDVFKLKVIQENLYLEKALIGGTQGNCHVSSGNYNSPSDRNGLGNDPGN